VSLPNGHRTVSRRHPGPARAARRRLGRGPSACYPPPVDLGETNRLLRAVLEGKAEAEPLLLERIRPRLVLWLAARMSPALRANVDPEDLVQEVLFAVHRGLVTFVGSEPAQFFRWTFRIAENRIRDAADRTRALKRRPVAAPAAEQTSPSSAAGRVERIEEVRRAVEALPEDYCTAVRLRRLEEREYEEVAEIMGRSANAVRVLYCRALQRLREALTSGRPSTPAERVRGAGGAVRLPGAGASRERPGGASRLTP
jgi:RNA polymerase sigma-70 factor (ECF subfamily)